MFSINAFYFDKGTEVIKDKVSQEHVCEEEVPLNNNIGKQSGDLVEMPSEAVEKGMDNHVPDEIDGTKGEQVLNHVVKKDHGFVGYPFDYRVTLGFGSIAGGLDHVNPVIRLLLEHGISRELYQRGGFGIAGIIRQTKDIYSDMGDDIDISALTIEQYLALIQDNNRPGIVKPKIGDDVEFKINSNIIRELRRKLFAGTDDEDAHKHVWGVLEIVDLFHFPGVTHDAVMLRVFPITLKVKIFYTGLDIVTRRMLDTRGLIPLMTPTQALKSIQVMVDHSHNWYDETTTRKTINDSPDNVDAIQESFKGTHLTKECPLEKKDKAVEQ
ncbi:hypothetical protein Tco_1415685, partial [Tanacetum coccineum]